ncbi:MAG: lytic transglycosylase domain-containing protein [Thermoanaerobacterales bacterium]|nr:lytic transglycosylase domain-containing protein [Bacillota bacterium]MDI6907536.1 lytic transglycosylase domain-containing protein [Thermoanaerobacterales bacterium]
MPRLWLILLVAILALVLNVERIGRHFYPFPYQEIVFRYAFQEDLDPFLLAAVIKTESNFRATARSRKGALGLMQVMPETGRWVAEETGEPPLLPDDLSDPETNIRLGTRYLGYLHTQFGDDPVLALAAYNAGRSNVIRWLEQARWTGELATLDQIPFPETRRYVRKVLFTQRVYRFLYRDILHDS